MLRKLWHFIKRIFGIVFIILFLAIIAVVIFIMTFDLNRYKDFTAKKLTLLLDRPVTIESMHTKLALIPTITISGFKIGNNEPFQDKAPLLTIQKMDAELELAPLLNSQINIHKIHVDEANINLFKSSDANNWILSSKDKDTDNQNSSAPKHTSKIDLQKSIHLNIVTIGKLNATYNDSGRVYNTTINNLEMKNFYMLSGELVYNKQKFTFNLNTGSIFDLLNQTPNFAYDVKIQSRLANLTLNGKIGDFKQLTGLQTTFSLRTSNLKNALAFLGIKHQLIPPQSAQVKIQVSGSEKELAVKQFNLNINSDKDLTVTGTGSLKNILTDPVLTLTIKAQLADNKLTDLWHVQPMTLNGDITVTPNSFKTTTATLDANRSDARLAADIKFGNKIPSISLAWASNFLNIYDFIKKTNAKPNETTQTSSKEPAQKFQIPWSMLKQANMNVNLNIKHLQVNDWFTDYVGITTKSTLYDGVLKFPFELTTLGGKVNGVIDANAGNSTLSFNVTGNDLNLNGLRPLNQDIQNVILQTKIRGNTKGVNVHDLLSNLNGKIVAQTNQGEIINKWFVNLPKVLNLTKKKQNVSFSNTDSRILITCAAANINISKGNIVGKDQLALETNTLNLTAGGNVNLSQKTMNILLHPSLPNNQADDWLDLSKYIRIQGPFDKLTPRVDTEQVAGNLIQAGVNKLIGGEQQTAVVQSVSGSMCRNVLKNETFGQDKKTSASTKASEKQPQKNQNSQPQTPSKKQFEQQLLNSLFQALAPQQ